MNTIRHQVFFVTFAAFVILYGSFLIGQVLIVKPLSVLGDSAWKQLVAAYLPFLPVLLSVCVFTHIAEPELFAEFTSSGKNGMPGNNVGRAIHRVCSHSMLCMSCCTARGFLLMLPQSFSPFSDHRCCFCIASEFSRRAAVPGICDGCSSGAVWACFRCTGQSAALYVGAQQQQRCFSGIPADLLYCRVLLEHPSEFPEQHLVCHRGTCGMELYTEYSARSAKLRAGTLPVPIPVEFRCCQQPLVRYSFWNGRQYCAYSLLACADGCYYPLALQKPEIIITT